MVGAPENWTDAKPYLGKTTENAADDWLDIYYAVNGATKYNLKGISRLVEGVAATDFVATHYGDWPAPEVFIINTTTGEGSGL